MIHYERPSEQEQVQMTVRGIAMISAYAEAVPEHGETYGEALAFMLSDLICLATEFDLALSVKCLADGSHALECGPYVPDVDKLAAAEAVGLADEISRYLETPGE